MSPENQWLVQMYFLYIEMVPFWGTFVSFRGCKLFCWILGSNRISFGLFVVSFGSLFRPGHQIPVVHRGSASVPANDSLALELPGKI